MKVRLVARAVLASLALASVSLASAGLASLALASRAQAQRGSASDISGASVTSSTVVRGAYVPGGRLEPIPVGATQYDPAALARIRNAATALDNQVNARALTGLDGATLSAEAQLLVLGVLKSATTGAGLSVNALRAILARGVPGQAILANTLVDRLVQMGAEPTPLLVLQAATALNAFVDAALPSFLSSPPAEFIAVHAIVSRYSQAATQGTPAALASPARASR